MNGLERGIMNHERFMPSLKCTIYYMHTGCPKTKEKNNCHVMHQNVISLLSNRINGYYVAIDLM